MAFLPIEQYQAGEKSLSAFKSKTDWVSGKNKLSSHAEVIVRSGPSALGGPTGCRKDEIIVASAGPTA